MILIIADNEIITMLLRVVLSCVYYMCGSCLPIIDWLQKIT